MVLFHAGSEEQVVNFLVYPLGWKFNCPSHDKEHKTGRESRVPVVGPA